MAPQLIFITGATGFIGSQTALSTLEAGHRIRLSVRKQEQIASLEKIFAAFQSAVEFVVIPNIQDTPSVKAAIDGVDHIFHLASPMPGKGQDFKTDYSDPAVQGTLAVLAAAAEKPNIKSVVVTSSLFALMPFGAIANPYNTIKDNTGEVYPVDPDYPFPEGPAGHGLKYQASKILAHQASRGFLKNISPHYKLITLHPVFVLGDSLVQTSAEDVGGINAWFWQSLHSEQPNIRNSWVHVRDVAEAHVKALDADVPNGTEFLLSAPNTTWEDTAQFVRKNYPQVDVKLQGPFEGNWVADASAAEKYLHIQWRSTDQIIRDVVDQQLGFRGKA